MIALAGDIERAILMVSVKLEDQNCLKFLWVGDINDDVPEVALLKFTHIDFGLRASPFLLNTTINHHIGMYKPVDPEFVDKFLASIYVDDVSFGADSLDSTYLPALPQIQTPISRRWI